MTTKNFTALDFETATPEHNSICQIGLVVVSNGLIIKRYSSLIKPPNNHYEYHNIQVHKIQPFMTEGAPYFYEIWEEISKHIIGQHVVCHNARFDLMKLSQTLDFFNIKLPNLTYSCTMELFGGGLDNCCKEHNIAFSNHHDALADAEACAMLFLKYLEINGEYVPIMNDEPYSQKKIEKVDLIPDFEHATSDSLFFKRKVVFTGDLVNFTRTEAAHRIKLLGADVNTSISKKTDFVILGRNPGPSKMEKIRTLKIPTITEDDFLKMLE